MDPYDEQRLRDEVIYLHSLWQQGPPRSTSTNSSKDLLHQLSNLSQFMGDRPKPRGENGGSINRTNGNQEEDSSTVPVQDSDKEWLRNPTSDNVGPTSEWPTVTAQNNSGPVRQSSESGKEWTCTPSSDILAPTSGWPTVNAQQNSLSHEQEARFAGNQAHFKALKATIEFFRSNCSDDDDEIGDDDDDDELGDDNESDEDEGHDDLAVEEYRFFVKVFDEDSELREYHEKNYHNGYFSCLVCSSVGIRKACKRFRDCVALIQHAVSVAKTKKRRAHRAYGKAICKVLGWDIHKLPTIVSALSANLDVSLSNSGISEGEAQGHVGDETKDNPNVLGSTEASVDITGNNDELRAKESTGIETLPINDESMISKKSLAAETSKCDEDPNLAAPKIVEDQESVPPSDGIELNEDDAGNHKEVSKLVIAKEE